MPWRTAASVVLDADGRYLDADAAALELLGVGSVEELRATSPDRFAVEPPDADEQEALRRAYYASRADGVFAEVPFRRLDGEIVRVRVAILEEDDGRFRALFYPIERPATDLTARVYGIADVLSEWRAAERRLVELDPEDEEARRLGDLVALLRDQHGYLFDRKREGPAGA
jgi:PAS domain-containing protein